MKTVCRQVLSDVFKLTDILLLITALLIADVISNQPVSISRLADVISPRISVFNGVLGTLILLIWHLVFLWFGSYNSKRFISLFDEFILLLRAVFFCTVLLAVIDYLRPTELVSISFIYLFFWISLTILFSFRIFLRFVLGFLRAKGRNLRYILIAGTGKRALAYARYMEKNPQIGYSVLGFIDNEWHGETPLGTGMPQIVCSFEDFSSYLRDNVVDEVVICLPIKTCYQKILMILKIAEEQGTVIRMSTDLFNLKAAKSRVEHIDERNPLITIVTGAMYRRMVLVKSLIDFAASLLLVVILLPVFIAAALAIKFSSRGPVFFKQSRVGMNKRVFEVLKFRTMVTDAEQRLEQIAHLNERKDGAAFKIKMDPRVTPVGKILRKFSIDELPQLFNVLKGDMSLVGPRPLPIRDFNEFNEDWQRRRFSVKPGITCIWQVSGRDNITFEQWMKMDMRYIDEWSLWLDLKILLKTVPVSILGVGAS
ncbi:sugar transferase [Chitinispirillales bacterium ANBcel5]|uniref:sugar transferase n=1 Tax=Cellulosispirillum alkaliphilum TaxID=3039283 RepID=UPI002A59409E|nr:sugar transferase [Chitinispirillales bacterium ANBcel5]